MKTAASSDSIPGSERPASGDRDALRQRVQSLSIPKAPPAGRSGWANWVWMLLTIGAAIAATAGYMKWAADRQQVATPAADPKPVVPVSSSAASPPTNKSGMALESKGYIIPAKQVLVSPKVSGMILKLNVVEGQRVAQGDVLAELEDTDYQADFARATATLEAAKQRCQELQGYRPEEIDQAHAELSEAQAQLEQYEDDWRRAATLSEAKALSTEVRDAAQSKLRATEQRVRRLTLAVELMEKGPREERKRAAEADVRASEAELAKAKWRLDNCIIRAPISGVILRKNAEEGNIVNPIAFNGSYSLCEMADLSDLEVELNIAERDVSKVSPGQKCKVRAAEAFPDRVYDGVVARLMPIADRAKGAIPVRVKVSIPREEEGVYLKPEMGAIVTFLTAATADVEQATTSARPTQTESPR
jgi:multidrug resistance efflux pump